MSALFVDTGGFCAVQIPQDRWHADAAGTLRAAVASRVRLVTTNLVVGETFTLLRVRFGSVAAWRFKESLDRSGRLEIVRVDERAERSAWALLRQFADQPFSFVDATSFVVMKDRRIRRALAYDRHFAAAGFVRAGVDDPPAR